KRLFVSSLCGGLAGRAGILRAGSCNSLTKHDLAPGLISFELRSLIRHSVGSAKRFSFRLSIDALAGAKLCPGLTHGVSSVASVQAWGLREIPFECADETGGVFVADGLRDLLDTQIGLAQQVGSAAQSLLRE